MQPAHSYWKSVGIFWSNCTPLSSNLLPMNCGLIVPYGFVWLWVCVWLCARACVCVRACAHVGLNICTGERRLFHPWLIVVILVDYWVRRERDRLTTASQRRGYACTHRHVRTHTHTHTHPSCLYTSLIQWLLEIFQGKGPWLCVMNTPRDLKYVHWMDEGSRSLAWLLLCTGSAICVECMCVEDVLCVLVNVRIIVSSV